MLGLKNWRFAFVYVVAMTGLMGTLWVGDAESFEAADVRKVSLEELTEVMALVSKGYDPAATTNGARFQVDVMLELVKRTKDAPSPLLMTPDDWFQAFLTATERTEEQAPQYVKLAHRHQQHMFLDPDYKRVVRQVKEGKRPEQAINVMIWWPQKAGSAKQFSYQDTLSSPNLQVTNGRVITYRLLDFGDCFFFDNIQGLTGRPTTGVLGLLFKLLGEGRVVVSGTAIAKDGLQITRGTAKKMFMGVTTTVTIHPDGKSDKDVDPARADLVKLDKRLQELFEIDYHTWKWSPEMDALIDQVLAMEIN